MRKIIIACFLVFLMLMTPITSIAQNSKMRDIRNNTLTSEDLPKILITEDQKNQLINFIEINFKEDEKIMAFDILNNIINTDLEVDIVNLSNKLSLYIYVPIPEDELYGVTNEAELNNLLLNYWSITEKGFIENLFGSLLLKIIEYIKDRLGWFYDLFDKSISLFYNGITLFIDIIKPMSITIAILFVAVVNKILSAPKVFIDATKELFLKEYDNFIMTITEFIDQFSGNLINLVNTIISFIGNPDIEDYFDECQLFINWLEEEHWKDPIMVSGSVKLLLGVPLENAIVTCRGESTVTDVNGNFNFMVDVNLSEDSFPEYQYYGMHKCQIIISYNNEIIKQTPEILSYSFSGGKIDWPFYVIKGKPTIIKNWFRNMEKINNLFNLIYIFIMDIK